MAWKREDPQGSTGSSAPRQGRPTDEGSSSPEPTQRRLEGIRAGILLERERELRVQALDALDALDEASERLIAATVRLVEARAAWVLLFDQAARTAALHATAAERARVGGLDKPATAPWPTRDQQPSVWSLLQPDRTPTEVDPESVKRELREWAMAWYGERERQRMNRLYPLEAAEADGEAPATPKPGPGSKPPAPDRESGSSAAEPVAFQEHVIAAPLAGAHEPDGGDASVPGANPDDAHPGPRRNAAGDQGGPARRRDPLSEMPGVEHKDPITPSPDAVADVDDGEVCTVAVEGRPAVDVDAEAGGPDPKTATAEGRNETEAVLGGRAELPGWLAGIPFVPDRGDGSEDAGDWLAIESEPTFERDDDAFAPMDPAGDRAHRGRRRKMPGSSGRDVTE